MLLIGHNHIDYFSLDVEGAELAILKTIPFERLYIDVLSLEYRVFGPHGNNHEATLKGLAELRSFFDSLGMYREVGILPIGSLDKNGLDIVFKRI